MIHVRIPATTANMGPGFDCIGMAFQMYNHLWVEEAETLESKLIIENKNPAFRIPLNENNLIYKSIKRFYSEAGFCGIPSLKIIQDDRIPLTRGLGSSAACVVGGLLTANALTGEKLSRDDLCFLAAKIEGHPDNSTPAIVGGIVVGALSEKKLDYIKIIANDKLKFAVMIPDFRLSTSKARSVLPKKISHADAVFNVSRAALMISAILTGDYEKLSAATEDRLHQPYRLPLVPEMDKIFYNARLNGASGVFLSGAGPSIIAIYEERADGFITGMKNFFQKIHAKWDIITLAPDNEGAAVNIT